jgi:hypothetical protein
MKPGSFDSKRYRKHTKVGHFDGREGIWAKQAVQRLYAVDQRLRFTGYRQTTELSDIGDRVQ